MSSFLKALSRIGLVELDDKDAQKISAKKRTTPAAPAASEEDELERLLRETQADIDAATGGAPEPAPAPAPPPAAPPTSSTPSQGGDPVAIEGRDLAEIYSAAGIPDAPFTVEKLLKVLDGLKALPPASRKAAVMALDSADDNWSIADVILDAQRKGRALREEQARMSGAVSQAQAQAEADLQSSDEYMQAATSHIRQQIAELETTLAQEVQQVTEQKAAIKAKLTATRDAAAREHARLEAEVSRISQIPLTFSDND